MTERGFLAITAALSEALPGVVAFVLALPPEDLFGAPFHHRVLVET